MLRRRIQGRTYFKTWYKELIQAPHGAAVGFRWIVGSHDRGGRERGVLFA